MLNALETAAAEFGRELPVEMTLEMRQAEMGETMDARGLSERHYIRRKRFEALSTMDLRMRALAVRVSNKRLSFLLVRQQVQNLCSASS